MRATKKYKFKSPITNTKSINMAATNIQRNINMIKRTKRIRRARKKRGIQESSRMWKLLILKMREIKVMLTRISRKSK